MRDVKRVDAWIAENIVFALKLQVDRGYRCPFLSRSPKVGLLFNILRHTGRTAVVSILPGRSSENRQIFEMKGSTFVCL